MAMTIAKKRMMSNPAAVIMGQICGRRARSAHDGEVPKALPSRVRAYSCDQCGSYLLLNRRLSLEPNGFRWRCGCGTMQVSGCYGPEADQEAESDEDYDH